MCLALLGREPGCSAGGELRARRHRVLGDLVLRAQRVSKAECQDLPQPGSSAESPSPGPCWPEQREGHTPLCVSVPIPAGLAPKV